MKTKPPTIDSIRGRRIDAPKTGSGVYFLFQGDEVVYVGQSTSVAQRIGQHAATKKFDSYAWLTVPKEKLEIIEKFYIDAIRPPMNKTISGLIRNTHRMPFSERSLWALDSRRDDSVTWDTKVVGLGVRHRARGRLSYFVRYRDPGGVGRKTTIGDVGLVKLADARKAAIKIIAASKINRINGAEETEAWRKSQRA